MVPKKRSTTTALHPGGIQTEFSQAGSSHFKSRRGEHKAPPPASVLGGWTGWGSLAGTKGCRCCVTNQPRHPKKGGKKEHPQAVLWLFIPHGAAGASLEHLGRKSRERNGKVPPDPRGTGEVGGWMGNEEWTDLGEGTSG